MATIETGVPIDQIQQPRLSLATVRWLTETQAPEDSSVLEGVEMFTVVGEQHRLASVDAAAKALGEEDSFLPPRFWLVPDDNNTFDPLAVAVHAISRSTAFHIGFLPKAQAREYRDGMQQLSRPGESLEVLGCITQGKSSPHPNGRIYLPVDFANQYLSGFTTDAANHIEWVEDASPIGPREAKGRPSDVFTFIELCKIYCWYARKRRWFCFPHDCEAKAEGIRSAGIGLARADFDRFMQSASVSTADETAKPATDLRQQSESTTARQWYYSKDGQEHGPFDAAGLRDAARYRRLLPTDRVRRGDRPQWALASRVKGLFVEEPVDAEASEITPSLADLLFQAGDLSPDWGVGPFEAAVPKMFDKVVGATEQGTYPLLCDGIRRGGITGFVFGDATDASRGYDVVRSGLDGNAGIVARLGEAARFSHTRVEMPPALKLPPQEFTDVVFVRGKVLVHIRMTDSGPDPAVDYAVRIDLRIGRGR